MPRTAERLTAGWRSWSTLRFIRRARLITAWLFLPVTLAAAAAGYAVFSTFTTVVVFGGFFVAAFWALSLALMLWPCPRCGERFSRPDVFDQPCQCRNCGLRCPEEHAAATTATERLKAQWRSCSTIRIVRRVRLLAFLLFVPVGFGASMLGEWIGTYALGHVVAALFMAAFLFSSLPILFWPCPRCGERFSGTPGFYPRQCRNCGFRC
jgi:asparagine N-glycosylation enzyme membrane subunit Stt3